MTESPEGLLLFFVCVSGLTAYAFAGIFSFRFAGGSSLKVVPNLVMWKKGRFILHLLCL